MANGQTFYLSRNIRFSDHGGQIQGQAVSAGHQLAQSLQAPHPLGGLQCAQLGTGGQSCGQPRTWILEFLLRNKLGII